MRVVGVGDLGQRAVLLRRQGGDVTVGRRAVPIGIGGQELAGRVVAIGLGQAVGIGERSDVPRGVVGERQKFTVGIRERNKLLCPVVAGRDPIAVRVLNVIERPS